MQGLILLGGKGTRLSALYGDRPKALVPICGRPFIEWQIEWLAKAGIRNIHLAAGYKADVLEKWLEDLDREVSSFKFQVSLSVEPQPLGTAGGLKFVEPHITSDPFYVLNGDSLMPNLSFQSLEEFHRDFPMIGKKAEKISNDWTTIAVTQIREAGRYGTVEFDAANRITAFREKANRSEGWINGGVYLMSRRALADIEPAKNLSIETDIFPKLAQQGALRAFPADPPLLDMGTPEGVQEMEHYLSRRP